VNVLISMMRPNRKGDAGARMARTTKNPKYRDHGRLLKHCEEAHVARRSGNELV